MDIKVIEPIKHYLKEFKTVDEFNLWYSKNKDEVDALTTHKLNKMYHIDGYRITKIKGVLMLKRWVDKEGQSPGQSPEKALKVSDIDELRTQVNEIRDVVNRIITFLQGSSSSIDVSPPSVT